jgi:hypothetical protein
MERWQDALDIIESLSRPASLPGGAWPEGAMLLSLSGLDALCRQKLGLPVTTDPRIFPLGDAVYGFRHGGEFTATSDGLWIADGNQLLQLDFNLKTNFVVRLPTQGGFVGCLCAGGGKIYIGTASEGLIEFDKATHQCRQWTERDGLYMNSMSSLCLQGDTLWIGYGNLMVSRAGGLGRLDLPTGRFMAFTPSLSSTLKKINDPLWMMHGISKDEVDPPDQPPGGIVIGLLAMSGGDIITVSDKGVQRYHPQNNTWEMLWGGRTATCAVCTDTSLLVAARQDADRSTVAIGGRSGLHVQSLNDRQWQRFGTNGVFPNENIHGLALDGRDVWLGGTGFFGVFNLDQKTLRKVCYTRSLWVNHMEIAGDCVWLRNEQGCLFRIPLSVAN